MMTNGPDNTRGELVSRLSGDPEMVELIELFVAEMPERVKRVCEAWQGREMTKLQRLAHQLKGASAGYGYPEIGSAAGRIEEALRSGPLAQPGGKDELGELKRSVDELIGLCNRVGTGTQARAGA